MDKNAALETLAALSQETRLDVFRFLVAQAPDGIPAGEIAKSFGVVQNTMSAHLSVLAQCGLITSRRSGRTIEYSADFRHVRALLVFLMQDCCQGEPEICEPLLEAVTCGSRQKR